MKFVQQVKKFKHQYEMLVEYFTNSTYTLPESLLKDLSNLFLLLKALDIDTQTFLVSNFRSYTHDDEGLFPYPRIKWFLSNSKAFRNYEHHHKVNGDKIGVINYSRVVRHIRDMKQDTYMWLEIEGEDLEERIKKFVSGGSSDIFKLYIKNKYFDFLVEKKIDLRFHQPNKISSIEGVLPFVVFDRIFKGIEHEHQAGRV